MTAFPPIFPLFDPIQSVFAHWASRDVEPAKESNADSFKSYELEAQSVVWVNQSLETEREADARPVVGGRSVVVRIGRIVVRVIVIRAVVDVWPIVPLAIFRSRLKVPLLTSVKATNRVPLSF